MPLNKDDIASVGYKAKIQWYKERIYDISDGKITLESYLKDKNKDVEESQHSADELIGILLDLSNKSLKLQDKIAFLSSTNIPIDAAKSPELSAAVAIVDASSGGAYISYALYDKLLREQEYVNNQISIDHVSANMTGDAHDDSAMIQDRIYSSYAAFSGTGKTGVNPGESYINSLLNNAASWNEHDYRVRQILNFSDNYLDMSPDPAYIPWSFRRDIGEGRVDSVNLADTWKHYSEAFSKDVGDFVSGVSGLGALRPDPLIHDMTTRYINYANNFLNQVNNVCNLEWAVSLVCCFMQWGVRLDLKTLKGLRALLQLMQLDLSFNLQEIINGIKDIINNIFRGLLYNQLMGLINQIIQRLVEPIQKWLSNPGSSTWKKIFECTPIDELINGYISQAIVDIQAKLYKIIQGWYKRLELQHTKNSFKIEIKTHQKWMGELARLLDGIIAVLEMAAQCGMGGSPNSDAVQQMASNLKIGNPVKYVFPEDANPNIYNSFVAINTAESNADGAAKSAFISLDSINSDNAVTAGGTMALSDCLKKIPVDDVAGVVDWMLASQTEVQGRV